MADDKDKRGAIDVVESPSFTVSSGEPMAGICPGCGADLAELARRGKIGHAWLGPGECMTFDPPS